MWKADNSTMWEDALQAAPFLFYVKNDACAAKLLLAFCLLEANRVQSVCACSFCLRCTSEYLKSLIWRRVWQKVSLYKKAFVSKICERVSLLVLEARLTEGL